MSSPPVVRYRPWKAYPWLVHGFSTRSTGDFLDWPGDQEICCRFGVSDYGTAMLRQVHSANVVRADHAWGGQRPEADGVVSDRPGILLGIRTADCVPILLIDPLTRCTAAVHAGWRGAAMGVARAAVRSMVTEFGASPDSMEAAIGPGIGVCCFEVGEEVAERFSEDAVNRERARPHVDLAKVLTHQLASDGVKRIGLVHECTSCNGDRYFSHRAENGKTGRMLSVVGLRSGGGP